MQAHNGWELVLKKANNPENKKENNNNSYFRHVCMLCLGGRLYNFV